MSKHTQERFKMANQRFQRESRSQNDRIDNIHHSDRGDRGDRDNDYYRSSDYYSSNDYRPSNDYRSSESRSDYSARSDYSPSRGGRMRDDQTGSNFDYQSSRSMSYRPQEDRGTGRYTSDFPRYGSSTNDLGYDADFYDRNYYGNKADDYSVRDYRSSGSQQMGDYRNYGSGSTNYSGRGPKGWKRSDDRIREDVCERLERDAHIDASEIDVTVNEGVVSLSGHVETRRAKRHAEDIIENLAGVRDVNNSLTVDQSLFDQAKEFFTGESSKPVGGKAGKGPNTSDKSTSNRH